MSPTPCPSPVPPRPPSSVRHLTARPRAADRRAGQHGQVLPLVAMLLVVAGLVAVGLVQVGAAASRRAAAQAAADASALAGAAGGRTAAEEAAEGNDAAVVGYDVVGADVVVEVARRGARATARARWEPVARR
ncbi:MAG TPA: pilus assembly protein TadG-related protein [Aquihabitans sp.]|nr:pilus assembly protein TadG-related protein [Aquihabitans sp.]